LNFSIILIFGLNNVGFRSFFLHFYAKNPHYNSIPPKKPRNSAYFVPKSAPEQGQVKVADFGVSGELADTVGQAHSWVGTTVWVAVAGGGSGYGGSGSGYGGSGSGYGGSGGGWVAVAIVAVATVAVATVAGWQWLGGSGWVAVNFWFSFLGGLIGKMGGFDRKMGVFYEFQLNSTDFDRF
jgi:hypothetical protein